MIRKLFISLIILSALSSEGLAELSGHFCGPTLGLANSCGLKSGQQASSGELDGKNAGSDIKGGLFVRGYAGLAALNPDNAKCRICDGPAYKGYDNYFSHAPVLTIPVFSRPAANDIVLKESDSSPPYDIPV